MEIDVRIYVMYVMHVLYVIRQFHRGVSFSQLLSNACRRQEQCFSKKTKMLCYCSNAIFAFELSNDISRRASPQNVLPLKTRVNQFDLPFIPLSPPPFLL